MSDNNFPSIYIARVFPNINERKIKETFENLFSDKNCIDRVDIIRYLYILNIVQKKQKI